MRLKTIAITLIVALTCTLFGTGVMGDVYVTDESASEQGNITYPNGVTSEMTKPSYWIDRTYADANKVMMNADEIEEINDRALHTEATFMNDLEQTWEVYDAGELRMRLASAATPTRNLYINGTKIDNSVYFENIKTQINSYGIAGDQEVMYGVCVKPTAIKEWPTNDIIGYSPDDTDDEIQSSSLMVNEPFVAKMMTTIDGHLFYWGYSNLVSGWVDGEDIAICNDRDEWIDAWKVDLDAKDFLVVTQDKIVLEPDIFATYASEVKLTFGTILKLVDKEDIPDDIGQRKPWNNYVVYLPTRGQYGKYEKKMALISEHCKVSVGFLPMTQANIIDVSLQCLGNRYGWGGMLDSMDCSLLTRNVYRCFGFEIPRNTTWQRLVPDTCFNLAAMDDETKQQFLEMMPAGTMLYFKTGHTMIYLGSENHVGYVVSALGTVIESGDGPLDVLSIQGVTITPLTVRRGSGKTWLTELTDAVVFNVPIPESTTEETTTEQVTQDTTTEPITQETTTEPATQETTAEVTSTEPTTASGTTEQNTIAPATSSSDVQLPKTKIKKVIAKKKSLKITWKKIKKVTGYKVQLATNKKFRKAKTLTVKGSKISKFVKGLKKKKMYFIRIRTYKIVKEKNKDIIYYSNWSKTIKKKTK